MDHYPPYVSQSPLPGYAVREAVPSSHDTAVEERRQSKAHKAPKAALTLQERRDTIDRINGWLHWKTEDKFQRLSPRKRRDREIVLAAVQKSSGSTFRHAHPQLRRHRPTVLAAVQRHGLSLRFASSKLRRDRGIVLAAVQNCGHALRCASSTMYGDRDIVLTAVQTCGEVLYCASATLQNDPAIVLAAVQNCGDSLRHASSALRDNEEIVLAAVQSEGYAVRYASRRLQSDARIVGAAVQQDGSLLRYASPALRDDLAMVLSAVTEDASAIQYASDNWKSDHSMAKIVVARNGLCFKFLAPSLRANRDLLLAAIAAQKNGSAITFLDDTHHNHESMFVECPLRYAATQLQADPEVILFQAQVTPEALMYASSELRADLAFMTRAAEQAIGICEDFRGIWKNDRFAVLQKRIKYLGRLVMVEHKGENPQRLTPHQLAAQWLANLTMKEEYVNRGLADLPEECANFVTDFSRCATHKAAAVELAACGSFLVAIAEHHQQCWWDFLKSHETSTDKE